MAPEGKERPKLKIPYCPGDGDKGHYEVNSLDEKVVSDYTGCDFIRLGQMSVFEFWAYLRDAVVYNCQQTEEGKEYLEKCWTSEQTEPDREGLRKYFGKG